MTLTEEQRARFETFGFLLLRRLFSDEEMDAFGREADGILSEDRQDERFTGEKRQAVLGFAEKGPLLLRLVEDDRIYGPIEDLLGPNFMWIGSDGNLYVGDTMWHSDSRPEPLEYAYTRIKVAFYLDPVTRDTGCLRVIPGSHMPPLHEDLEPLRHLRRSQQDSAGKTESEEYRAPEAMGVGLSDTPFGVQPDEIPGTPLESTPGDAVFFNQRLWHASFGGRAGRRMFTLNYGIYPSSEDQKKLVKLIYESSLEAARNLQYKWTDQLYTDGFLHSDRPRIQRMMAVARELGLN